MGLNTSQFLYAQEDDFFGGLFKNFEGL